MTRDVFLLNHLQTRLLVTERFLEACRLFGEGCSEVLAQTVRRAQTAEQRVLSIALDRDRLQRATRELSAEADTLRAELRASTVPAAPTACAAQRTIRLLSRSKARSTRHLRTRHLIGVLRSVYACRGRSRVDSDMQSTEGTPWD